MSKWNQLQRHDLNKYLFQEFDAIHGVDNLWLDYDQEGGFEGMRQKAWTVSTIMILKLALEECAITGELMGQGDNQIVHIKLTKEQEIRSTRYIKLFLNCLDNLFNIAGLKLKLQETFV